MGNLLQIFRLIIYWFILSAPLVYLMNTGIVETTSNLITYDVGVIAYVGWLLAVYIITKPKWLLRVLRISEVMAWHRLLGPLTLLLALGHYWFSFSMHEEIKYTGLGALVAAVIALLVAIIWLTPLSKQAKTTFDSFRQAMRQLWSYQTGRCLHRLYLLAIVLGLVHVHMIPRIAESLYFMMTFDAYTLFVLASYAWYRMK